MSAKSHIPHTCAKFIHRKLLYPASFCLPKKNYLSVTIPVCMTILAIKWTNSTVTCANHTIARTAATVRIFSRNVLWHSPSRPFFIMPLQIGDKSPFIIKIRIAIHTSHPIILQVLQIPLVLMFLNIHQFHSHGTNFHTTS